jgi:hypothetical protein
MRVIRIPYLILALTLIAAAQASAAPTTYSLDGIVLGSTANDAVSVLGKPNVSSSTKYEWINPSGGTVTTLVNPNGRITLIDVVAGKHEHRQINAAGGSGTLGETGHVNFIEPPNASGGDLCGAMYVGSPCIAYTLPGGAELVANFGEDNGMSDWYLSELVLGSRDQLAASGRVKVEN